MGSNQGRSTAANLGSYQDYLISSIEAGHQVDAIYTDLSKAFDSVHHGVLLKKLSEIGLSGNYIKWIESYLSNRYQRVTVLNSVSCEVSVTSGVPQGSHIGPVLFLLFINDVTTCFINSHCLLFADDLKFFSTNTTDNSALQSDLNRFTEWCQVNSLSLNVTKCTTIHFSKSLIPVENTYKVEGTALGHSSSVNDLGVIFDTGLSFNLHIDSIVCKAYRMLGFVKRHTQYFHDTKAIMSLYNCFVRSILEYCSIIWQPRYVCHIDRIERVQRKFVKYLLFKYGFPYIDISYETRLLLCGMQSLELRRKHALLLFLFKLLNGTNNCHYLLENINFLAPIRRSRHTALFNIRRHRTNYGRNAFVDRLCQNYNKFFSDCDIFNTNLLSLKRTLKFGCD